MPVTELCFEAFQEAISGLDPQNKKADASTICSSAMDKQRSPESPIADYLALRLGPTFAISNACAAGTSGLRVAWSFIKSGLHDMIAVIGVAKMSGLESREVAELMGRAYDISWESSFGLTMAARYSMYARAHMRDMGQKRSIWPM